MNPESTWLDACGQEMELLGLSVAGLCDRQELPQAVLSPSARALSAGVPTVSLLGVFWSCACGTLSFQLGQTGAGDGSDSNSRRFGL